MEAAISAIRTHDTHKLLSAKAAFLRLSPDEKARFARFFEAEAPTAARGRAPCGGSNFSGPFRLRLARAPSSSSIANPLRLARREQGRSPKKDVLCRVDGEESRCEKSRGPPV
jgi:hypothetical protein